MEQREEILSRGEECVHRREDVCVPGQDMCGFFSFVAKRWLMGVHRLARACKVVVYTAISRSYAPLPPAPSSAMKSLCRFAI
eukprot:3699812-Prymnesium_polylepis.1